MHEEKNGSIFGVSAYSIKRKGKVLWKIMHFIQKNGTRKNNQKFDRSGKMSIISLTNKFINGQVNRHDL